MSSQSEPEKASQPSSQQGSQSNRKAESQWEVRLTVTDSDKETDKQLSRLDKVVTMVTSILEQLPDSGSPVMGMVDELSRLATRLAAGIVTPASGVVDTCLTGAIKRNRCHPAESEPSQEKPAESPPGYVTKSATSETPLQRAWRDAWSRAFDGDAADVAPIGSAWSDVSDIDVVSTLKEAAERYKASGRQIETPPTEQSGRINVIV